MIGGDVGGVCDEIAHWRAEDTRDLEIEWS